MNVWAWVRIMIVAAFILMGLLLPAQPAAKPPIQWQDLGIIFAFIPVGLLFVVGLQALNRRSAIVWRYPSWWVNPFNVSEPLQFFHLGGYSFLAYGMGVLLQLSISNRLFYPEAFIGLIIGAGALLGVHICTLVFRRKMKDST